MQIKNIEMQNIDRYLLSIGTQAALIAGFASSVLLCDSLISFAADETKVHKALEIMYYSSTTTCLVLEFFCVMNSTLVSVFGPTYALNGPSGSMHIAVTAMREERITILYAFGLGSFAFGISQICVSWMIMPKTSAIISAMIIVLAFVKIYLTARRVMAKFRVNFDIKNSERIGMKKADDYLGSKQREEAAKRIDIVTRQKEGVVV